MNLKVDVVKKENAVADINVEIPQEELEKGYKEELEKFRKTFKMPGFRPGKVPTELIEKKYKSYLETEAIQKLVSNAYYKAIIDNKLNPYGEPNFSKFDIDFTKPLSFTATVELSPYIVELGDYKNISVHKDEIKVSDDDIKKELELLQDENAELITKTDPIKEKDVVVIDAEPYENGELIKEGVLKDYKTEVNTKTMLKDIAKGLIGMKKGDSKEIKVKYPDDFFDKKYAGKKVIFKVTVKDVMQKKIPELNDEFAKDLGEYKDLEDLKNSIRERLEKIAKDKENASLEDNIVDEIIKMSKFAIPESLVEQQTKKNIEEFEQKLKQSGLTPQQYYEIEKTTEENVRKELKEKALKTIYINLILTEIAKRENIKVEEDDINNKIKEYSKKYNLSEDVVKNYIDKYSYIKTEILFDKVLDFLKNNVEVKKGKTLKFSETLNK